MSPALTDQAIFGPVMGGPCRHAWRSILLAAVGEPLEPDERATFRKLTSRDRPPSAWISELVVIAGRRGGKTSAAAALVVWLAAFCKFALAPGERGIVLLLAQNRRVATVTLDFCAGLLEDSPVLRQMVVRKTSETIELSNGIVIEVRPASFRGVRGLTAVAVVCDETSFWMDDETSRNPDTEVMAAVAPMLLTTKGPLIVISSAYRRSGVVWEAFDRDYGPNGDPRTLVARGTTIDFNPTISQDDIDDKLRKDAARPPPVLPLLRP